MPRLPRTAVLAAATAALAVIVGAVVAEVGLRLLYPENEFYYALVPDQIITLTPLEEHVPGVTQTAVYRTSSWGIRGPEFNEGQDYRILAIGGSTTQNAYLDQSVSWPLLLGLNLSAASDSIRTWSGDVGRSGHTARSHLLQLRHIVPQLPSIDVVVVLVGVNDLTVALRQGSDYAPPRPLSDPSAYEDEMRRAFVQVPGRLHDRLTNYLSEDVPFLKRTALYQLLREVRNRFIQARGGTTQDRFGEIYSIWRSHRAEATAYLDVLPDLATPLEIYRGYLQGLVDEAARQNVRLILMTQPVLWRDDLSPDEESLLWLGGLGDFQEEVGAEYFTARALREAMDRYNRTLLDVCSETGAECVDLAAEIPADTTMFYDDVHFTERGSQRVADVIVDYLVARPPYAPVAQSANR